MKNSLELRHPNLKLMAYAPEKLDLELDRFTAWVEVLLGLKGEDSTKSMLAALPYIKQNFWSMGMGDVKKAFEMYATGKLSIKPIPNYFNIILVGQIFNEYRDQRPAPPPPKIEPPKISEKEKENILATGANRLYEEFKKTGRVDEGNGHIYDWLDEKGRINLSGEQKRQLMVEAALSLKKQSGVIGKVAPRTEGLKIAEAKRLALEKYYAMLVKVGF